MENFIGIYSYGNSHTQTSCLQIYGIENVGGNIRKISNNIIFDCGRMSSFQMLGNDIESLQTISERKTMSPIHVVCAGCVRFLRKWWPTCVVSMFVISLHRNDYVWLNALDHEDIRQIDSETESMRFKLWFTWLKRGATDLPNSNGSYNVFHLIITKYVNIEPPHLDLVGTSKFIHFTTTR